MDTLVVSIDLPPSGGLEASGGDASSAQAQEDQGTRADYDFIKAVSPYLQSLVDQAPRRAGNVDHVELLSTPGEQTAISHYMLVIAYDMLVAGDAAGIEQELSALLPQGARLSVGGFTFWQEWRRPVDGLTS